MACLPFHVIMISVFLSQYVTALVFSSTQGYTQVLTSKCDGPTKMPCKEVIFKGAEIQYVLQKH